jgi:predicted TIM-barrel fold metal-dependent hydrolase
VTGTTLTDSDVAQARDRTPKGRRYHLISADSHVNEPPGLWTDRFPAGLMDRAPRLQRFEEGDGWVFEGVPDALPIGLSACAGQEPALRRAWVRFEDIRRGGWDPAARLEEIDRAGVDAEVLYPSPRVMLAMVGTPDPELHLAMVRAYNDWLAEYVEYDLSRFRALPILPNRGREDAIAEIERVGSRPSTGGFLIGAFPGATLVPQPEDDPIFATLAERGLALHVHVGLNLNVPTVPKGNSLPAGTGSGRYAGAAEPLMQLILAGVFDRIPDLRIVFAEVDCGWVPYFKEQIDDGFLRYRFRYDIARFPSEYVRRHAYFTYVTDGYGIDNRHRIGVDRIMWSSDYPHGNSNYPDAWSPVKASMSGVDETERDAILADNAKSLYGFGG